MADLRQSKGFANYLQTLGWKIEHIGKTNIFIRPLWIFGSIAKIRRAETIPPLEEIKKVLKNYHSWLLEINYSATKTLRIDLNDIRPKKDCRSILRKLQTTNHKLQTNDFESFYRIWHQSAKRKSLWIPGKKEYFNLLDCFGKNCFCLTIDDQAGALILIHEKIAYYYYAGATKEGTKANLPYLVVWESMQEAKKRGCKFWDFEGIYDARFPNKGWLGFSHFKKSFGGTEIEFPGNTTIWL